MVYRVRDPTDYRTVQITSQLVNNAEGAKTKNKTMDIIQVLNNLYSDTLEKMIKDIQLQIKDINDFNMTEDANDDSYSNFVSIVQIENVLLQFYNTHNRFNQMEKVKLSLKSLEYLNKNKYKNYESQRISSYATERRPRITGS